MPVTTIDPQIALLVIDLQKGVASSAADHPIEAVIRNARALADAFRKAGLPVVLVNVAGGAPGRNEQAREKRARPDGWTDLLPSLGQQPDDLLITKKTWGAFTGTGLSCYLQDKSITQVVIAGVVTSIGVESTARQAHELGLNVTVAIDAVMDRNEAAHRNSITNIFPRLGETGSTREIIDLVEARNIRDEA